ncbi:MAG: ABC transporter, partial [Bacteroidota bacterium]
MKALKYINKYFKKYRTKLLVGIVITIIARVFSLVLPPYVNKSIAAVENFVLSTAPDLDTAKAKLIEYIMIIIGAAL